MRGPVLALLATALAVAMVPTAQAATALLTFSETFGTATMDVEGTIDGSEAAQLRGYMDLFGNRDGNVSQAEVDQFLTSGRDTLGDQAGAVLTDGNLTLDGNPLAGSELQDFVLHDAPGPVQAGPPIGFEANLTFLFLPTGVDTHVLALEGRPTPGGALRMTFQAPPGWDAQATVDGTAVPIEGDALTVQMPADGGSVVVTFTLDPKPSPGLGISWSLATLGLATWVRLRTSPAPPTERIR